VRPAEVSVKEDSSCLVIEWLGEVFGRDCV